MHLLCVLEVEQMESNGNFIALFGIYVRSTCRMQRRARSRE
jgi:hypothetical protein